MAEMRAGQLKDPGDLIAEFAIAITAEFSPAKWRAWIVAVMFCFYSLGAGFGGLIAAWLVPTS